MSIKNNQKKNIANEGASKVSNPKIKHAMMSHQGHERETNDDKVFASAELGLYILSDGVGGLAQGEQASQFVVDEISKSIGLGRNLKTAVHSAHSVIKAYNKHEAEDRGATVVAMLSNDNDYEIAWVGDTRAYCWNVLNQELTQLTEDHTLVQKLINAGLLNSEEAINHPKKHVITQCLGIEDQHQLDIGLLNNNWNYGDLIIIASDGLYEEVSNYEIQQCLKMPKDNQTKVEQLIDLACKNGGKDNLSLILVESPILEPVKSSNMDLVGIIKGWFKNMKREKL